jgi:hypothetical protein
VRPPAPHGTINTTDPDCNLVRGQHGWRQGDNPKPRPTSNTSCSRPRSRSSPPDLEHLQRIVTRGELEAVGITRSPGAILADTGYRHVEQTHRLAAAGIPVLIPPDSGLCQGSREFLRCDHEISPPVIAGRSASMAAW